MSRRLWAVGNNTGTAATLTNDEGDSVAIAALGITHTGGTGGDFVYLSDCSDSTYWPGHHMTISSSAWSVSCWVDDQNNRVFMWSAFNGWSSQNIVQNSGAPVDDCSIMINLVNGSPVVTWQPW